MRLVICSEYFAPDTVSTGRVLFELAEALLARDAQLEIAVIRSSRAYRALGGQAVKLPRLTVHQLRALPLRRSAPLLRLIGDLWFSAGALWQLLRLAKPDVVLVVTNPFVLPAAAALYKLLRGVPYLYLIHDLYPDIAVTVGAVRSASPITALFCRLQRWMLGRADAVVALGRCMAALLAARYGVPAPRLQVITNWADPTAMLPPDPASRQALRARYGLAEFVCLYSGNLGHFHDFDTLLDAAALLRDRAPYISFLIVGEGGAKPHIARRVAAEQLDNVVLSPLVPHAELPALLAAVDVAVVSLSRGAEGQAVPLKLYNLMAAGKPIIAISAPHAEVAQVVREHGCGVQVAQGDARGLALLLEQLAASPQELQQMGQRARAALEQRYTLAQAAERYAELLRAVAQS